MFAFRRIRATASRSTASADTVVDDAENIVRLAWRRDLHELRRLAEEQLQTAVADGLQAYEELRQAQRDNLPRNIAGAHSTLEEAIRLTQRKTANRDRIDELIEAESDTLSEARPVLSHRTVLARLAAALRRRN